MVAPAELMTAEELLSYQDSADRRVELERGRLLVSEPHGFDHGAVLARVSFALSLWVRDTTPANAPPVGEVVAGDSGFWIARNPDTVRAPSVAFVAAAQLPRGRVPGFLEQAPTLAVEVLSPNDRPGAVLAKVGQWLEAGTALVWVIDPSARTARAYRADGSQATIEADGVLQGEAVLPGFTVSLAELLG